MVSLAQEEKVEDVQREQYVIFQIGSEEYGVDIDKVKEIIKPSKITNVPNTEEHVMGVINLRGQIVPVVDLHEKFDFKVVDGREKKERIITVEVRDALIGLFVDDVHEVIWLENKEIAPAPEVAGGIKQEFLEGVAKINDRLLVIIE